MANFTAAPVPTGEVDNFVEFILHGVITNAVAFVGFIGNLGTMHILCQHFYNTKLHVSNNFFTRTGIFCQNRRIHFSTLHFEKNSML